MDPYQPTPSTEDEVEDSGPSDENEGGPGTFFVPKSALEGHECKAGDVLTFKVLGLDSDGDAEVKLEGYESANPGETDNMMGDLRDALNKPKAAMALQR